MAATKRAAQNKSTASGSAMRPGVIRDLRIIHNKSGALLRQAGVSTTGTSSKSA